jgi:alpha-aminoadipate carrier protein LysW
LKPARVLEPESVNQEEIMASNPTCPICDGAVATDASTLVGELIECDDCCGELVVTSLSPISFEEAPTAEEDWGE